MTRYRTRSHCVLVLLATWGLVFGTGNDARGATGAKIAFSRSTDQGMSWSVCVMDVDGANIRQLDTPTGGRRPQWAPDGASIYYLGSNWGDGIWVMADDTANKRQLTNGAAGGPDDWDMFPAWYDPSARPVAPHGKLAATWGWAKGLDPG